MTDDGLTAMRDAADHAARTHEAMANAGRLIGGELGEVLMAANRPDTVDVYQDQAGEWRWRRVAPNGDIVADSGESYTRKHDARRAATRANPGAAINH